MHVVLGHPAVYQSGCSLKSHENFSACGACTVPKGTLRHEDNCNKGLTFSCQHVLSHGELKPNLLHTQVDFQGQLLRELCYLCYCKCAVNYKVRSALPMWK